MPPVRAWTALGCEAFVDAPLVFCTGLACVNSVLNAFGLLYASDYYRITKHPYSPKGQGIEVAREGAVVALLIAFLIALLVARVSRAQSGEIDLGVVSKLCAVCDLRLVFFFLR